MESRNANYYTDLAKTVGAPSDGTQAMLQEFAEDERKHQKMLQAMWRKRYGDEPVPPVGSLDDFEIPELIEFDVDPKGIGHIEVLEAARQAEMTACFFYERAAENVGEGAVRALLLKLAALEHAHLEELGGEV